MEKMQQENFGIQERVENTKEEAITNQNEIVSMLAEHQFEERKINSDWKKFIFEWQSSKNENLEITKDTRISRWLYPIKFNIDLAIIMEAIQRNMALILASRTKGMELIYSTLNIDKEKFYRKIEDIQNLLIDFGKVKVCGNGTVILMNESCEIFLNRRTLNENKEIFI